ncbi:MULTISPECIES: CueP family metal-binding protein [Paenibacillus]|uniref:Uncharacterized protein n=1 Tax=Paenibacillus xylanilyticus TaxID=248903 RepID=A0A7Y6C1C8_9BACL|nr:CueP family metal-binding protein [Paenibacillus xylanilyticus]NUU77749.1 hypothetical protein [Paenibacillus xylanilyticus]
MRKGILIAALFIIVVGLGIYLIADNVLTKEAGSPGSTNVKELVYDISTGKVETKSASINATQLVVTGKDDQTTTYNLPDEEFFLSIAPYVEQTHPCAIHSLTGCQGEMKNEEFQVTLHDSEGNTYMKDEPMKTGKNGFMDLWVPRNRTYLIRVVHDGKVAESQLSTYEQDNTCITTMELK